MALTKTGSLTDLVNGVAPAAGTTTVGTAIALTGAYRAGVVLKCVNTTGPTSAPFAQLMVSATNGTPLMPWGGPIVFDVTASTTFYRSAQFPDWASYGAVDVTSGGTTASTFTCGSGQITAT